MSATLAPTRSTESKPADKPPAPKSVAAALLTMAGSTGVISVYGPLTGTLFWEGKLSTKGLVPTEFPASDSEVRMYAFKAIAMGLTDLWSTVGLGALVLVSLLFVAAVVYLLLLRLSKPAKEWVQRSSGAATKLVGRRHPVVKAGAFALGGAVMSAVAMVFLFAAFILILGPYYARSVGEQEGLAELKKLRDPGTPCMSVKADGFAFTCPHVFAYRNDYLAVLDGDRIFRVPREKAVVVSLIPQQAQRQGPHGTKPTK